MQVSKEKEILRWHSRSSFLSLFVQGKDQLMLRLGQKSSAIWELEVVSLYRWYQAPFLLSGCLLLLTKLVSQTPPFFANQMSQVNEMVKLLRKKSIYSTTALICPTMVKTR
jgi:hypothetical protein